MHIKRENGAMVMSDTLVCTNYGDNGHFISAFERVGDNEYKCADCGVVMVIKEPVLIHGDKGRLKMQVAAELKQ